MKTISLEIPSDQIDNLIDERSFRGVLRNFGSTVMIVTTTNGNTIHGMTATSFAVVSFQPPMILICIYKGCRMHKLIEGAGYFAVNFLNSEQWEWSERFAGRQPSVEDRFADITWIAKVTGSPILTDCPAWLDCRVAISYPSGDHTIFIGKVLAGNTKGSSEPLLYCLGKYSKVRAVDGSF